MKDESDFSSFILPEDAPVVSITLRKCAVSSRWSVVIACCDRDFQSRIQHS
jgi:hypothetical protein